MHTPFQTQTRTITDVPPAARAATPLQPWFAQTRGLFMARLQDARGVHLETTLSGLGAVAGCLILRETGTALDRLTPGKPVFITAVDELGPRYFDYLANTCAGMGIDPQSDWTTTIPVSHQPLKTVPELTEILEPAYGKLCDRLAVPPLERIRLVLFTAASLIDEGRKILNPGVGKALVLSAMVAGAKTVPPTLMRPKAFWQRLFV